MRTLSLPLAATLALLACRSGSPPAVEIPAAPDMPPAAAPAAEVPDCFGDYRNGDAYYRVARDAGGELYMEMDDGLPWRLTCHEDLLFQVQSPVGDEPPVPGRFVPDRTTGEIALMEIGGRVAKRCHRPEGGWLA